MFLFIDVYNFRWDGLVFSSDEGERIMIAWHKQNFALEEVMKKGKYLCKLFALFGLVVCVCIMIAVDYISSY